MPYSWSSLPESWQLVLRRSSLVLALKVAGALAGYLFAFVALQRLGAAGYGYFELAFTVLSIASVVAKWGLDGLMIREVPARSSLEAQHFIRQAMTASLLGSALLALGLWTVAPWIAAYYGGFTSLWRSVALVLPAWTLMQVWSEAQRAQHRYLLFGVLQSSVLLGTVALAMLALPWLDRVERVLLGLLAATLILVGRGWLALRRVELRSLWTLRAPATAMFLTGTLFMVMTWTDTLMIGYFLEPEVVGGYRVAFKIGTLITFAQFAVNASLGPRISELWTRGRRDELQSEVRRVTLLNAAVSLPAFAGIMLLAPWLLSFFSPDLVPYAGLLRVLALGQVVNALCGPVMYLLNLTGHEQSARRTMTVAVLVNAGANLALIPWLGVVGAAWATSASMVLWNVWATVAVYRKTGIRTLFFWR
jgi:O-antigen/teichoic acid export membrane protein